MEVVKTFQTSQMILFEEMQQLSSRTLFIETKSKPLPPLSHYENSRFRFILESRPALNFLLQVL